MPYCNFAIMGLSEMKVKSLRRQVNGSGTIRARKMSISATKRRKTWKNRSKHGGHIADHRYGVVRGTRAGTWRIAIGVVLHSSCLSLPSLAGEFTYQTVVERHFDSVIVALGVQADVCVWAGSGGNSTEFRTVRVEKGCGEWMRSWKMWERGEKSRGEWVQEVGRETRPGQKPQLACEPIRHPLASFQIGSCAYRDLAFSS